MKCKFGWTVGEHSLARVPFPCAPHYVSKQFCQQQCLNYLWWWKYIDSRAARTRAKEEQSWCHTKWHDGNWEFNIPYNWLSVIIIIICECVCVWHQCCWLLVDAVVARMPSDSTGGYIRIENRPILHTKYERVIRDSRFNDLFSSRWDDKAFTNT